MKNKKITLFEAHIKVITLYSGLWTLAKNKRKNKIMVENLQLGMQTNRTTADWLLMGFTHGIIRAFEMFTRVKLAVGIER